MSLEQVPGLNVFSAKQVVKLDDNDLEVVIKTRATMQPHEKSQLLNLGWVERDPWTYAYTKLATLDELNIEMVFEEPEEPDPEEFE